MGIYDSGISLDFGPEKRKALAYAAMAIAGILIIAGIGVFGGQLLSPSQIEFRFEKNPVKSSETAKVFVTVTNISDKDAKDVQLSVSAKEETELGVFPSSDKFNGTIPDLSRGTSREVAFVVNPI